MDFDPSQEQQQIRDSFARFCDQRIRPVAAALDEGIGGGTNEILRMLIAREASK